MMTVQLRLFARAEELAGQSLVPLAIPAGGTIGQVRTRLGEEIPALVPLLPHLLMAVNEQYVRDSDLVADGATIAVFPPVSGG